MSPRAHPPIGIGNKWRRCSLLALALFLFGPAGPVVADFDNGMVLFEQGRFEAAGAELLPLAETGDARAQYVLGVIYQNGLSGKVDPQTAASWFRRAAKQGYVEAQVELGRMYREGDGVDQDPSEMIKWYKLAAEQGDVGAQLFVADAYAYGHGVETDRIAAYMWYEVAMRYWGSLAEQAKLQVASQMTPEEITEAKQRASRILPSGEGSQ